MGKEVRRSGRKERNACTDLDFPQWEHIMHHLHYKNAMHGYIIGGCVQHTCVPTLNRSLSMGTHHVHVSPVDLHWRGGHL